LIPVYVEFAGTSGTAAEPAAKGMGRCFRPSPGFFNPIIRNKSLFASFSSEKEESCSFLKKRTKRLLLLCVAFENPGLGRRGGCFDRGGSGRAFREYLFLCRFALPS
jgi:hypothetical protein